MLSVSINNPSLEKVLLSKYKSNEELEKYFSSLVEKDIKTQEDKELKQILLSIKQGLEDIKHNRTKPIEQLWDELED